MKKQLIRPITDINADQLYSIKDLLSFLPISRSCLYKWIDEQKVPVITIQRRKLILGKYILKELNLT